MEPSNEPIGVSSPRLSGNEQAMAIASIIMGVTGLCLTLFLGFCGLPFPFIGLVLGYLALKDPKDKTLAIIGLVISGITLLLICVLVFLVGGLTLLGPVIGNVFSSINQSLAP